MEQAIQSDFFPAQFTPPKRKRGRPKGTTKSMVSAVPGRVGRPRKDKNISKIKTTILFHLTKACESQVIVHRGSARSSKSYSIAQYLLDMFFTVPKIKILILRKTQPSLRTSVVPLVYQILDAYNLRNRITEVKQDRNIWSPVKGLIHFGGLDDPEKIRSSEWNIIWIEEATAFSRQDYLQLKLRLSAPVWQDMRNKIILSFNPVDSFHWIKKKLVDEKTEDFTEIHSTYRLNPFLSDDYRATIESLKYQDENYYKIFAEGVWGTLENIIYKNWQIVPAMPSGEEIYGLDFGFTNPTALVRCFVDNLEVGVESVLCRSGLTNRDLISEMDRIFTLEQKENCPIFCDNAEPARIQELNDAGFYALPADKSVKDGIDFVRRCRLKVGAFSDDIVEELRKYSYRTDKKTDRVFEEPIKWDDHLLDAIRYALYTNYCQTTKNIPSLRVLDFSSSKSRDEWEDDD